MRKSGLHGMGDVFGAAEAARRHGRGRRWWGRRTAVAGGLDGEEMAAHVMALGRALWASVCHHTEHACDVAMCERMRSPRPGDLVMETTHFGSSFTPDAVGYLVRVDGPPQWPTRYVIEPLHRPGHERVWEGVLFIALPDRHDYAEWARADGGPA